MAAEGNLADSPDTLNPLSSRGYEWDSESELYYLKCRYHSPKTCRFVNCDVTMGINDAMSTNNLFVCCGNNGIVLSDRTGFKSECKLQGFVYDGSAADFSRLE